MSAAYQPSREAVERLLAQHTPRQLAIGYLRAQRRFRESDLAFRTLAGLVEAEEAEDPVRADYSDVALAKLEEMLRRLRTSGV